MEFGFVFMAVVVVVQSLLCFHSALFGPFLFALLCFALLEEEQQQQRASHGSTAAAATGVGDREMAW